MDDWTDIRGKALDALAEDPLELGETEDTGYPEESDLSHWRWHIDADEVAWLLLDKAGSSVNTLSEPVLRELKAVLPEIMEYNPAGLVLRSAKPSGFMMGADIDEFDDIVSVDQIALRIDEALQVLDDIENLPVPTVALLHGFCLGGGLELALACTYRIARPDARIGFPEVLLGLHPGLGGTWRSLRHMAPTQAIPLMLTGRNLTGEKARKAGLVDDVAEERHMRAAAARALGGKLKRRKQGWTESLQSWGPARNFIAGRMTRETEKKVRQEHYPAPFALIDLWREHAGAPEQMRHAETHSFSKLIVGETAQNLIRVFHLRENLKAPAKETPHGIEHVHVIGAGTMGGDIAAWCAAHGFRVTLEDRTVRLIGPAIGRATATFERRLKAAHLVRDAHDRLQPDPAGAGLSRADLVIEAVPEELDIKRAVYERAEAHMKSGAMLATNTSSIQLERLSALLKMPERFVGLHFFNPVARMPLLEVVTHGVLRSHERARATAFAAAIDKLPLLVKSAPGFLVNRTLTPYLMEALVCLDEGMNAETIDEAALAFGMPMGPIELADQVGLDVCLHVASVLAQENEDSFPEIPAWFRKKVDDGELGRKSGKGLYRYRDGKPVKSARKTGKPDADLTDRLILPMVNATVACLRETIVEDPEMADAGIVFGTGFAPFRGGPLNYARQRGVDNVMMTLRKLRGIHGPRFLPDKGWPLISTF